MASPSKKRDGTYLPYDVLASILSKYFVTSEDYIRFSIVCKHWHSVAKAEKQNHMATRKQIPFLLIPSNDLWSLYSVVKDRLLNSKLRVQVPSGQRIRGSSHGWLIFAGNDDNDITLLNPFSQAQISLPRITYKERPSFVENVILSADPSLHPNDYIVAACIIDVSQYVLALIQPGRGDDVKWMTLTHSDWQEDEHHFTRCDMVFDRSGKWVYASIGYKGRVVRAEIKGGVSEIVVEPGVYPKPFGYLGEESSGEDLLMFTGLHRDKVKVWKLQGSSFVELNHLVGDHTSAFIGHHSSTMLVGRGSRGVETDCVYYYRPGSYDIMRKFNLKDGKYDRYSVIDDLPSDCYDIAYHPVWILPSVNL